MEMLKVLLVDDEILAIEDVRAMIDWEAHGYRVVAVSTSSAEALELYKKYSPQIVITDINMPVMNGLTLCKELKMLAKGEPLKMILLTAYSDFDYAKSGFEIGVSNYILKHEISEIRLLTELEKIREQLSQNQRAKQIIQREHLYELMNGKLVGITEGEGQEYTRYQKKSFLMMGAKILKPHGKGFLSEIQRLDINEEIEKIYFYEGNGTEFYVLAVVNRINSQRHGNELVDELAASLREEVHRKLMTTVKILTIAGGILPNELAKNYLRLQDGLRYSIFAEEDKNICFEDISMSKSVDGKWLEEQIKVLEQRVKDGEATPVMEHLDFLFRKTKEPFWNVDLLNRLCSELCHGRDHFLEGAADVFQWSSFEELKNTFRRGFLESIRQRKEEGEQHYSRKTYKIIQYIHHHYGEPITIEDVAENTGMSAVYLCQIFKKETGVTFLEYLTDYRIKIAKELIENGDYKIYEISEMVGYKTSQYFSQVFKKATGINPMDYKK